MDSRVELFELIRREHDRGELSQRALAVKYRVHRRTVKQALDSPAAAAEAAGGPAGTEAGRVCRADR